MSRSVQVNQFKELLEKYPTWDDMRKYLESEEGGLFRITNGIGTEDGLAMIRYEKGSSNMTLSHSRWFRSVVWDTVKNLPVCMAPPKVSTQEISYKSLTGLSEGGVVCQELLDGFMINCFRVAGSDTLHITSRSRLDAAGKFYSEKTFRELFTEAFMNTSESPCYSETIIQDNSNDIIQPDSSKGEIATFYSFLVQHSEHRIVTAINRNRVFIVHKGSVFEDGRVVIDENPAPGDHFMQINSIPIIPQRVSYARILTSEDGVDVNDEVQKWVKTLMHEKGWDFQGLVFKDGTGNRWRYRSEKYSVVKALRGNAANHRERFAQLFCQNLIPKYLEYYPEDTAQMSLLMIMINSLINILYTHYVDLHITKKTTVEQLDKMYLPHLYSLHGIYLSQLRPEMKKMSVNEIALYLHKQPWQRISFLVKKAIDKMNSYSDEVPQSS
jgi:hypothetical protein